MPRYARLNGDTVAEIIILPVGININEAFCPDVVLCCKPCDTSVMVGWSWDGAFFTAPETIEPTLDEVKTRKVAALTVACAAAIVGGYTSTGLGSDHIYPSAVNDQINMMGSVTGSLLPDLDDGWSTPFWCADQTGEWAFRQHSAVQIQQAGRDGKAHVVVCQTTLDTLAQAVIAAATIEAVEAIIWPGVQA